MSKFLARKNKNEGCETCDDENLDKLNHVYPQCGQSLCRPKGSAQRGQRRCVPSGRMPTLLGGASIASGYTPSALAGAKPRRPLPLKGCKSTIQRKASYVKFALQ